jgi:hypothetical protein
MRLAELHTLPKSAVKAILDSNLASMKVMKPFSEIWKMTQNVVDICSAILRTPVDDETGN